MDKNYPNLSQYIFPRDNFVRMDLGLKVILSVTEQEDVRLHNLVQVTQSRAFCDSTGQQKVVRNKTAPYK